MKFFTASLFASLAAAAPFAAPEPTDAEIEALVARDALVIRQLGSQNELEQGAAGSCPKAILVFARGTTEQGNLVSHEFACHDLSISISDRSRWRRRSWPVHSPLQTPHD